MTDLPLWTDGDFLMLDTSRIKSDYNFEFKKVNDTVDDLIDYYSTIKKWAAPVTRPAPISTDIELELIKKITT